MNTKHLNPYNSEKTKLKRNKSENEHLKKDNVKQDKVRTRTILNMKNKK